MRIVILLVACYYVVSQPVIDELKRLPRELIECCPCPGSSIGGQDMLNRAVDDCPCRLRSADSEGASSMFLPSSVRSDKPIMRSNNPKDDQKNLLEPEVGLATSMLETLREATEEDYQDALARDAARSADAIPEESARNMVIIVKPRTPDEDDFVSEASNVKETRCIHPLGTALGRMRSSKPMKVLPDIFRLPKAKPGLMHRNLWDMDSNVGASDRRENVVDKDGDAELKPRAPLFKFRTPLKENGDDANGLKPSSVIEKLEQSLKNRPNLFERFNLPVVPKLKIDGPLRNANNNNNKHKDLSFAPSNNEERAVIEKGVGENPFNFNKRPLLFKNLLKLKDVELLPKNVPKRPFFKSQLNTKDSFLPTSLTRNVRESTEDSTYYSALNEKVLLPKNMANMNFKSNLPTEDKTGEIIAKDVPDCSSEILEEEEYKMDAMTSPSELKPSVLDNGENKMAESEEFDNCDSLSLEEVAASPIESISKEQEGDGSSNKLLDPLVEQSDIEVDNENKSDNIVTKDCSTEDISEIESDDSNTGSSFNTETVILPTSKQIENTISHPLPSDPFGINVPESESSDSDTDSRLNTETVILPTSKEIENTISHPLPSNPSGIDVPKSESDDSDTGSSFNTDTVILPTPQQTENTISDPIPENPSGIDDDENPNDQRVKDKIQTIVPSTSDIGNPISLKIEPLPPFSETMSSIKENVRKSLENLRKTTMNISPGKPQDVNQVDTDMKSSGSLEQGPKNVDSLKNKDSTIIEEQENPNPVTFKDLQKLSDDLLDLSSNKEQIFSQKITEPEEELADSDIKINYQQKLTDNVEQDPLETEADTKLSKYIDSKIPEDDSTVHEIKLKKRKGCLSGFDSKTKQNTLEQVKSVSQDIDNDKMIVEASSPVASRLPGLFDSTNLNKQLRSSIFEDSNPLNLNEKLGSPLLNLNPLNLNEKLRSSLQGIIAQPTIPEDPLNLLGKPLNEVLKLPTLEDLRQRLSSVFNPDERSTEDIFSDEDGDYTNNEPVEMAPAASTVNLRKLSSKKPFEDLNIDLFQLNPLSSPQSDLLSKAPRLNLNNFRTKLPIPKNLDLKPVKLESRVSNGKSMLGAAMSFGPDRTTTQKVKPSKGISSLHPLGQPFGNLPTLDDLRNSLHSGTQNLLGNSLQPPLDLFRDSNPLGDLENIRRNAEKTMKGLQQRMKSTLDSGNITPLSEKFARPQDLLEDVNDKLKGIHYDLNDRLSSMHENFLDQVKFNPLVSPARIPEFGNNKKSNNVMTNIRKLKGKPLRLQTSASSLSSQEVGPFDTTDSRNSLRSEVSPKRVQGNLHRILTGAESAPVPTKVEFPKPRIPIDLPTKTILPLSQRSPLRQGTENIFPQNERIKPFPTLKRPILIKDILRPTLKKPSPSKNKKVTITFATTTVSPITTNNFRTSAPFKDDISTGPVAGRLSPVKSKNNFKTAIPDKNFIHLQNVDTDDTQLKPSFKVRSNKNVIDTDNNKNRLKTAWAFNKPEVKSIDVTENPVVKPQVWPKTNEDSFLAKVREAMQARLASFDSGRAISMDSIAPKVKENVEKQTDMIRAASENTDVTEEPLKENVSYKCRMVCTREK